MRAAKSVPPMGGIRGFQAQSAVTRLSISVRQKLSDPVSAELLDLCALANPSGGPLSVRSDPLSSPVTTEVDSVQPAPAFQQRLHWISIHPVVLLLLQCNGWSVPRDGDAMKSEPFVHSH